MPYGHHADPIIDAEIEIARLRGLLADARGGLLRALDFQAASPNGINIKCEVRCVLDKIGWKETPPAEARRAG
jgi:hypothetical protein